MALRVGFYRGSWLIPNIDTKKGVLHKQRRLNRLRLWPQFSTQAAAVQDKTALSSLVAFYSPGFVASGQVEQFRGIVAEDCLFLFLGQVRGLLCNQLA